MRKRMKLFSIIGLAMLIIVSNFVVAGASKSFSGVTMKFDKKSAKVGEIVIANVVAKNIPMYSGGQFNIKYDPEVLQPVNPETKDLYPERLQYIPFTNTLQSNILLNPDFLPFELGVFDYENGIINIGHGLSLVSQYKLSGDCTSSGTIAKIGFKVLKKGNASISFADTETMPGAINGTMIFNCDSEMLTDYSVIQQCNIKIKK